jgi:hypothetical protein
MARWGTQFGHRGRQTLNVGGGPQRHTMTGSRRRGGNGGAADARVGVVGEHRATEAEVGDTEAAPDSGQSWLATGRCSGDAGVATRARGRAKAQASCEARRMASGSRVIAAWRSRGGGGVPMAAL